MVGHPHEFLSQKVWAAAMGLLEVLSSLIYGLGYSLVQALAGSFEILTVRSTGPSLAHLFDRSGPARGSLLLLWEPGNWKLLLEPEASIAVPELLFSSS